MNITAPRGLARLKPKVVREINRALEERIALGLEAPKNVEACVQWCGVQSAAGAASYKEGKGVIYVHALQSARKHLKGKFLHYANDVETFFATVSDFLEKPGDDNAVLECMRRPKAAIDALYKQLKDPKENDEFLQARGTSWEEYRTYIVNNTQPIKYMLRDLTKEVVGVWAETDLRWVRHEADHLDFMEQTYLWKKQSGLRSRVGWAEKQLAKNDTKANSNQLAIGKAALLEGDLEATTLLEIRAHFFDWINGGEWTPENIQLGAAHAANNFLICYARSVLVERIVGSIVSQYWAQGGMDSTTSNLVHKHALLQAGSDSHKRYVVDISKANSKVSREILTEHIPAWQSRFARNGEIAAEACAKAFTEDTSRFAKANKAKNFGEYVKIISG